MIEKTLRFLHEFAFERCPSCFGVQFRDALDRVHDALKLIFGFDVMQAKCRARSAKGTGPIHKIMVVQGLINDAGDGPDNRWRARIIRWPR